MRFSATSSRAALLAGIAGFAASASLASIAKASILSWNNLAGGTASTAANWNPAQVPLAGDSLNFNLNNTYTVTYNITTPTAAAHTYKKGTVTLNMAADHTVTGNFRVGDVSGDTATATITTGTLSAGSVTIGNAAGSVGTVNVNAPDADLATSGSGDIIIGSAGTGTLNVTGGGRVQSADDIILGNAGGDGNLNVSGFGTAPFRFSSINTTAADGDIVVGNSSGTVSTLTVGASGFMNCSDDLQVGLVGGASGVVNVSGTATIGGDLQIGNNSTLTTAGSGTVTALNNGTINVAGAIRLGDTTAGSGTLTCREGGAINAHSIICDTNGGFLNLLGGETHIDGGVLTAPNNILSIEGATGETPFLRLMNGASCTLSAPTSPFRALTLGISKHANLDIQTGCTLNVTSGDVMIGDLPGADATLTLEDNSTGSFPASRTITVGSNSFGHMNVLGNSTVTAGSVNVGAGSSGIGSLLVYGSNMTLSGTLGVGGTPTFDGGTGEVRVEAAGVLTVNAAGLAAISYGGGTVLVFPGATLRVPNGTFQLVSDSSLTVDNGTLEAKDLNIGVLSPSLRGTLSGSVAFDAANMVVNPTGPLTINGTATSFALNNLGTINVGNTTLTINGGGGTSSVGNCTLGPTGLITGTAPLANVSGKTISGDGTINNNISNAGSIIATGNGLDFGGLVTGVGQGMSGVKFTFKSTGGFTGTGAINAQVVAEPGSTLTFTGNSLIGDGTNFGATIDGTLDITGGLTISDSNGVALGSLTTLRNATLTNTSQLVLNATPTPHVLQGSGFVSGTLINAGVIRPGISGGVEPGLISVLGSLTFQSGSVKGALNIDLAGSAPASRDRVTASGPITAAGTLNVSLINGFNPPNGFSATVLSSTQSVSGLFTTTNLPPHFHVEYGPKDVFVVFCAADFDNDGFITGEDFDQFVAAFEAGDTSADFDGDGFVTGEDFDAFVLAFEAGC